MSPDDPRHGTRRGRYAHEAAGQEMCDACREAHNRYERRRRKSQALYRNQWKVDATGSRRRIQALYRIGWTGDHLAAAIGTEQGRIDRIVNHQKHVHVPTAKAIAKVYDDLSMTFGPSAMNRSKAKAKGWLPPLAWDDDSIDDPATKPNKVEMAPKYIRKRREVDEVVIERFLAGDVTLPTTPAERREIVRRWSQSHAELGRLTGWKVERYIEREDGAA